MYLFQFIPAACVKITVIMFSYEAVNSTFRRILLPSTFSKTSEHVYQTTRRYIIRFVLHAVMLLWPLPAILNALLNDYIHRCNWAKNLGGGVKSTMGIMNLNSVAKNKNLYTWAEKILQWHCSLPPPSPSV